MISGISHLTFIVNNLEKSSCFLKTVFDAEEIYSSGERTFSLSKEKFFLVGGIWLCIMEGDAQKERTYNHVAFQVAEDDFDLYVNRVKDFGVDIRAERPRVTGEGRSIYFYDFDNHLFELHTGTLAERIERYSDS